MPNNQLLSTKIEDHYQLSNRYCRGAGVKIHKVLMEAVPYLPKVYSYLFVYSIEEAGMGETT